jgi:hypothetical protein
MMGNCLAFLRAFHQNPESRISQLHYMKTPAAGIFYLPSSRGFSSNLSLTIDFPFDVRGALVRDSGQLC